MYYTYLSADYNFHSNQQDEVGVVGALLMGSEGVFITGSDFLVEGGVTAAYWYGDLASK